VNPERPGDGMAPEFVASPELERPDGPRIYVASLSDYNDGRLHGEWIDADQPPDDIHRAIRTMLAESRDRSAEEWAIHDYEGFGPLHLSEYESIEHVAMIGQGIAEHGPAFAAWAAQLDRTQWEAELDEFDERYRGQWNSTEEYAEELLRDMGIDPDAIGPEILQPYVRVDLEAFGRDLAYDLVVCEDPDGSVHVFDRE
jgi:antirestriction protein